MKQYKLTGRVVLREGVIDDGAIVVRGGVIEYSGAANGAPDVADTRSFPGMYIAPGFVDIHCHAGGDVWAYENPSKMAAYHLAHGTTSLLCTLYRDLGTDGIIKALDKIKKAMPEAENIAGAHLEGPYLNPAYGSKAGGNVRIERSEYMKMAQSGIIKQWTFAPEVEGSGEFLSDIVSLGIKPAIGHSAASPAEVKAAALSGAAIVTHLFCATGASIEPTRYGGTLEVSFDHAALLQDNLFYEIICDKNGVHVRGDIVKLAIKTVGVDRIIGVTDACTGSADSSDVNFLDGELMGSKLTMDRVAKNFASLGLSADEVFRVTSYNGALAVGIANTVGSLEVGKRADIVVCDDEYNIIDVIKS